jgi:RHS repeat-associated protein
VWRWDQAEPFGNNPADEDPDANSVAFDLPLRLPGQYFDKETNLHYNYFRDYDPGLGIYKQSDLIGLGGGLNTYLYVAADPLYWIDLQGLNSYGSGETICHNPRTCYKLPVEPTPDGPKPSPQPKKPPKNHPALPKNKQPGDPGYCAEKEPNWFTCMACCQSQAQRSVFASFTGGPCRDQCSHREPPYPDAPYQTQAPLVCRPT